MGAFLYYIPLCVSEKRNSHLLVSLRKNVLYNICQEKKANFFFEIFLQVVLIGDSGVGKSSLLKQFANKEFKHEMKATIGMNY